MNRADRRRQAKLEKSGGKPSAAVSNAIASMMEPIAVLLNAREFDRAEAALKEALAANPNHAEGLHLQGLLLSQTGREEQGIVALRRATSLEPKTALYWSNLAAAHSRLNQLDAAVEAAATAIAADPDYADPLLILGNVLMAQGKTTDGIDTLIKFARLRPNDAKLWRELAQQCADHQRFDLAEEAYKMVLGLEPNNFAAMRELASIYMNTWRYGEAQELRKKADQLDTTYKF
jgi:tetratricopeptide (TPR) repeat protein